MYIKLVSSRHYYIERFSINKFIYLILGRKTLSSHEALIYIVTFSGTLKTYLLRLYVIQVFLQAYVACC